MKNNIPVYRKAEKLTQKELATKAGLSERNLQEIESGRQDPKTSMSLKIAKTLNKTVEDLFAVAIDETNNLSA